MTNEEKEQNGQIPPKIKLKNQNGKTGKGNDEQSGQKEPPEAKTVSGPKSDTSRVELPADHPKTPEKGEDQETPQDEGQEKRDETMRVVLPKADQVETGTYRKSSSEKPKKTIKLKRHQGASETEQPKTQAAQKKPAGQEEGHAEKKDVAEAKPVEKPQEDTSRIDLSKAQAAPTEEQVETAKNEDTMRVVLDEATESEQAEKTGPKATPSKPPRTVKIKRSDMQEEAGTVAGDEEEKSETAKLDLPDSGTGGSSEKKTIKIKRPESTGTRADTGKTLKISRPEAKQDEEESTMAEEPQMTMEEVGAKRPHAVFAVAAIFTVLITGVLIYVMCAQMPFGEKWPWPNKIITEWQGSTELI